MKSSNQIKETQRSIHMRTSMKALTISLCCVFVLCFATISYAALYPILSYTVLIVQRTNTGERSIKYVNIDASLVLRNQQAEPHYHINPTRLQWDDPDAPGRVNHAPFVAQLQLPPGERYAVYLSGYTAGGSTPTSLATQEFAVTATSDLEPLQIPPAPTGVTVVD